MVFLHAIAIVIWLLLHQLLFGHFDLHIVTPYFSDVSLVDSELTLPTLALADFSLNEFGGGSPV